MTKPTTYFFTLRVEGASSKASARLKVLAAFAKRNPDGASFHLKATKQQKEIWMDGARAGTEIAFDLIERGIQNLRKVAVLKKKTK